jgi:hypothetical protein
MAALIPPKRIQSWGINLAEGCWAVNDQTRRLFKQSRGWFIWFISFVWSEEPDKPANQTNLVRVVLRLCSLGAFLYKNDCAGH